MFLKHATMTKRDHISTKTMLAAAICDEQWKPVEGYDGCYEVSDLGRVRSIERVVMRSTGHPMTIHERIRKQIPHTKTKHLQVVLSKGGRRRTFCVHQLVAKAFLGKGDPGDEVRHWDGVKTHNYASNLLYGSRRDNEADKTRHGTSNRGERNGQAKLTEADVLTILRLSIARTNRWIGEMYNVKSHTISRILAGTRWGHLHD